MEKFIARVALIVAAFFIALGNFWFTFGIWPKSWWSFALFCILNVMNSVLLVKLNDKS